MPNICNSRSDTSMNAAREPSARTLGRTLSGFGQVGLRVGVENASPLYRAMSERVDCRLVEEGADLPKASRYMYSSAEVALPIRSVQSIPASAIRLSSRFPTRLEEGLLPAFLPGNGRK